MRYSFGIGLFMYQSLDAIDGKQARRTQTSGPLGELFDHGNKYRNGESPEVRTLTYIYIY